MPSYQKVLKMILLLECFENHFAIEIYIYAKNTKKNSKIKIKKVIENKDCFIKYGKDPRQANKG